MKHIFVEKPYGPEAINFYEFVFGAKVMCRVTETIKTSDKNKGNARFVSSELNFGPNSIILSERNPDSSMVDKTTCASVETPTVIWLDMKDIDPVVARAKKADIVFDQADITTAGDRCIAKIKDPYGIIWMVQSLAKMHKETED